MEAFGADRWGMIYTNRLALDMGIPVAGNSDYGSALRFRCFAFRAW